MKTIFISIFDGDTERVILRTDVFSTLKESGHRLVLLIRGKDRLAHYEKEYGSEEVLIALLPNAASKWETFWYYLSWNTLPTRAGSVRRVREYRNAGKWFLFFLGSVAGALGHVKIWREFLRSVYFSFGASYADALFDTYKPDLLFAANMFSSEDTRLLRTAKRRGIKTVTIAKSWDVLTTKAFTRVKADRILVYNECNRNEAISPGDYSAQQVTVTGFPQFDIYTNASIYEPREVFCTRLGLDPARRIVLYGLPGDWKSPDTRAILTELDRRIASQAFVKPLQILARFHPKYQDSSEGLAGEHIVFDRPGIYFGKEGEFGIDAGVADTNRWTFGDADILHLANSIYHSDVVINVDSTLTLDAAALDKSSILIGFDGNRKLPYRRSIAYIYEREHYRNVLVTGAAPLVRNYDELQAELNGFLFNPDYKRKELNLLKAKLLYKIDGMAGKRMGEAVLDMLN
ncbi:MAG: hypothetical protein JO026_01510 [Patescibacteria group bacterium]|nr:hypothetical protein [Patescibacteria group bacterium]